LTQTDLHAVKKKMKSRRLVVIQTISLLSCVMHRFKPQTSETVENGLK